MFIDSHAHLFDPKFDSDLDRVLDRATTAGIERIITLGDNLENSKKAIGLALCYPMLLAAVGIHPHHAREWTDATEQSLRLFSETPRVVAIGEIGLDYHYHPDSCSIQRKVFRRQLALAHELGLPVAIHCREAYDDLLCDMKTEKAGEIGGAVHCFTGNLENARAIRDQGFYLGVGGTITFPNAQGLREIIVAIGIDYIILETDSPYLSPQCKRGRRNEPAHLPFIARIVADLTGHGYRDVARTTRYNTLCAFRLARDLEPQTVFILEGKIHINLTNDCTNDCRFCHKQGEGVLRGIRLRMTEAPSEQVILDALGEVPAEHYSEVVFSGLGEPTLRLDTLKKVASVLRGQGKRIVLETNGQANLSRKQSVLDELEGLVDSLRVSLNAPDRETYNTLCHPEDPEHAFDGVVAFLQQAKGRFPEVVATAVDLPEVHLEEVRTLAEKKIGVPLVVRPLERVT
jgi:TatD DNase family protein